MKKFLLNSLAFSLLMILLLIGGWWIVVGTGLKKTYTMPVQKHIVFLGNSQIQYSVDPDIVKGAFNFGLNADKPEYVYAKLKLLTKYNNQIDTVVIGMNHLFALNSKYVIGEEMLDFPDYIGCWTPSDLLMLSKHYPSVYMYEELFHIMNSVKLYGYLKTGRKGAENRDIVGTYSELHRDKLYEDLAKLKKNGKKSEIVKKKYISEKNIYFINKIQEICREKNITLFFMIPPMYHCSESEKEEIISSLHRNFPNIRCYNYVDFQLPDSCYGDMSHINYRGAKIFSEYLNANRFRDEENLIRTFP